MSKQFKHLSPAFLQAMEEIGELGLQKHGENSFYAMKEKTRKIPRHTTTEIMNHARQHTKEYELHLPHDHFHDLLHQLAAVAFNAMVEAQFAHLVQDAVVEPLPTLGNCNCSRNMDYMDWSHEPTCPLFHPMPMNGVQVTYDRETVTALCKCGWNYTAARENSSEVHRQALEHTPCMRQAPSPAGTAKMLPLTCTQCNRDIGPLYPIDADCAGWMCDECYAKLATPSPAGETTEEDWFPYPVAAPIAPAVATRRDWSQPHLQALNYLNNCVLDEVEVSTARLREILDVPTAKPSAEGDGWIADGVALIAAERKRQVEAEGWSPEHDDEHIMGEMIGAAITYAGHTLTSVSDNEIDADGLEFWPWDEKWWKPSLDPIRNLVKAGALIAAEIDRLKRLPAPPSGQGEVK